MFRRAVVAGVVFGWASFLTAVGQAPQPEKVQVIEPPSVPDTHPTADLTAAVSGVVERTNAFRKKEGREAVAVDDKLAATAKYFAEHMARNDRYGHTADGNQPADRAKRHQYAYCLVSENIAYAFNSGGYAAGKLAEDFFVGWRESPGHRKNMLDPDVTETGVAIARSETTGYYYAVQMFGRPRSAAVEFKVENRAAEAFEYAVAGQKFSLPPRYTRTHIVCRPTEMTFTGAGGADKPEAVKPAAGAHLVVSKGAGGWAVTPKTE